MEGKDENSSSLAHVTCILCKLLIWLWRRGGIRTRSATIRSATCRFCISTSASDAIVARAAWPILADDYFRSLALALFGHIGGSAIGKTVFGGQDNSGTIARRFANFINAIFDGVQLSVGSGLGEVRSGHLGQLQPRLRVAVLQDRASGESLQR